MPHALIVDDDVESAESLRALVLGESLTVAVARTLRDARRQIALQHPDILLLDLRMPDGNGLDLLKDASLVAAAEVVMCTAYASIETSIQALRLGAADYLIKPINLKQLQGVLSRIMKPAVLAAEVGKLTAQLKSNGHFGHLWGRSAAMQSIYGQISKVAASSVAVFISGESGTGKEVVAQTVHDLSRRRKQPFLAVNCGAISPNLIESEIFGHEKGSFTGADRLHQGFFERASGGTLFLDEITEMPLDLQVKLLRVLETGRISRVGSSSTLETDVRIIAATNRPPLDALARGRLREDLWYRLNVFPIELPPLRERLEDVPLLARHFLLDIIEKEGQPRAFSDSALARLMGCSWPGNVRELRNAVQRAYVMASGDIIDEQWLPQVHRAAPTNLPQAASAFAAPMPATSSGLTVQPAGPAEAPRAAVTLPVGISLAEAEKVLTLATLRHFKHQKERTAAVLGVSLKTLYNRLKEYAADDPSGPPAPND